MFDLLQSLPVSSGLQAIIGVVSIIILTFMCAIVAKATLFVLYHQFAAHTSSELDDRLIKTGRKHVVWIVYVLGAVVLFNYLERISIGTAPTVFVVIDGILYVLGVGMIALFIVRMSTTTLTWYGETLAVATQAAVDEEFVPLADRAVKVVMALLSLLVILDHFEVDIKGLLAVLGVGSLAIALAAQETLANMIGGFVIMIDRPFRKGDRVRFNDGTVVTVERIGIRSTRFLTFDNTMIITPNAELMKSTVHNLTYPHPQIRMRIEVGVGYDSDLEHVREVMLDEATRHPRVLKDPAPAFYFLEFGESALHVSLRCRVADVIQEFDASSELRQSILDRFRREGIEIPFPQRVVTMVEGGKAPVAAADRARTKTPQQRHGSRKAQSKTPDVADGALDIGDADGGEGDAQ